MPNIAQPRLLLLEDDLELALIIRSTLAANGFEVRHAPSLAAARALLAHYQPDLILLDLNLTDGNGRQLISELQSSATPTPVIVISAVAHPAAKVRALEDGADDFVVKPFHHQELIARIQAVLRRSGHGRASGTKASIISFGRFVLDLRYRELRLRTEQTDAAESRQPPTEPRIALSSNAFALLRLFATHPYQLLTRERIAAAGLGRSYAENSRSIDVLVASLRKIIEEDPADPRIIKTIWGSGYVFNPTAAPASPPPGQQSLHLDP